MPSSRYILFVKYSLFISNKRPHPSPVLPSAPTPPLCVILTNASIDLVRIDSD